MYHIYVFPHVTWVADFFNGYPTPQLDVINLHVTFVIFIT